MKRFKYIIVSLLLLLSSILSAQQELDEYLMVAANNNPGLKSKFNDYMAALEITPQVKALPDPSIAFGYFIAPVETRTGPQQFKVSASQLFPWFGTLKTRENVSIQNAKAKYEIFLEEKSKLFNAVRSTYYDVYFNRRAIDISRENLFILNTFRNLARIKVEAGKVSVVDGYRIEMEIGDLENQLASLIENQYALNVKFNNLLNVDGEKEIVTPETLWTTDLILEKHEVQDSIASNNHQLLGLSLQQEALSYRKELAQKQGKPDFSIGLDYIFVGQGPDNLPGTDAFVFPKVGLKIPLFRNKYKAMVNEVVFLQNAKDEELVAKVDILETILEKAWKEYLDSDRRIDLFIRQQKLAEQSLKLLETEYATDNIDFEEMLRMERKLLSYKLNLEKARTDKQTAISFINYLMGE